MTWFIVLLASWFSIACSFNVTDHAPNGFTVSIGKTVLLEHTRESPIFYVGKGDLKVTENSGNFFFDDKIYARIPLFSYKLWQSGSSWTVVLTQGDVTATLQLSATGAKDVEISVISVSDGYTHFWLRVPAETDEQIYGAGEQFSFLNLRERVEYKKNIFPIWINEQGE
ncbi:hypothetical protein RRG08_050688 [Elysia crispata]|uniref:Uncharacterized protein n=1 Tax=Elysia crispata TaxID=231223 RepID=A0AAE1DS35_9GAST|nr:hypothetical protein RRG08_050688 [Elysia crispata]